MDAVERLKRDHLILRSKLDLMEAALGVGEPGWFVLRELCLTLSRQLQDHIRREEELVAAARQALNPQVLAEVVVEHQDEPEHLRTINRLFVQEEHCSLERIRPALLAVISGLRRHMAEEERELFPILERVLTDHLMVTEESLNRAGDLDETMTVNRIVRAFPCTRKVFERLFINSSLEGCACLDEVAWSHGMESRELLDALEVAVAGCGCAAPPLAVEAAHG